MDFDGDVDKGTQAIYKLAHLPEPPLRLPLGKPAIAVVRRKMASLTMDTDKYESWSEDLNLD